MFEFTNILRMDLQLFGGEGAGGAAGGDGAGAGVAAETGGNAPDAGEQRLRELGVPEERLKKRSKRRSARGTDAVELITPAQAAPQQQAQTQAQDDAAEPGNTEETQTPDAAPARMSWEEISKDPEYSKEISKLLRARVKEENSARKALDTLAPALEVLARSHGMDIANIDYGALAEAVNNDDAYYTERAMANGVSVDVEKQMDQQQRENARQQAAIQATLQQQAFQNHVRGLERQAEEMKKTFPNFDLRKELQDPRFARMTSPGGGLSVEDAYYAIHRQEIQAAAGQVIAQQTAQQISNAIQAGQRRPAENGTSGQAPSVTTFDYKNASKQQREAFKKQIYDADARGQKIYPGQLRPKK